MPLPVKSLVSGSLLLVVGTGYRLGAFSGLSLSSLAGNPSVESSCPISASTAVVIYSGDGATAECRQWEHDFYAWLGLEAVALTAAQLQDSACGGRLLQHGIKIFAMPGGNSYNEQTSAGPVGKKNILAFIDGGGLYVGTCAGWYFASEGYYWQMGETGGGEYRWSNLLGRFPLVEGSITTIHDDSVPPGYALTRYRLSNGTLGHGVYWGGPTWGWR